MKESDVVMGGGVKVPKKILKREGIIGKRTGDIRLPSRKEMAQSEAMKRGLGQLGKLATTSAKQTVKRAISRK